MAQRQHARLDVCRSWRFLDVRQPVNQARLVRPVPCTAPPCLETPLRALTAGAVANALYQYDGVRRTGLPMQLPRRPRK